MNHQDLEYQRHKQRKGIQDATIKLYPELRATKPLSQEEIAYFNDLARKSTQP